MADPDDLTRELAAALARSDPAEVQVYAAQLDIATTVLSDVVTALQAAGYGPTLLVGALGEVVARQMARMPAAKRERALDTWVRVLRARVATKVAQWEEADGASRN